MSATYIGRARLTRGQRASASHSRGPSPEGRDSDGNSDYHPGFRQIQHDGLDSDQQIEARWEHSVGVPAGGCTARRQFGGPVNAYAHLGGEVRVAPLARAPVLAEDEEARGPSAPWRGS